MFSIFYEWMAYIYGFLAFFGFGKSPLFEIDDKYTDPSMPFIDPLNQV